MPRNNNFRHHRYLPTPPQARYELLVPDVMPPVGSEEFERRMGAFGRQLRTAGVGAMYLIHGTFVGDDPLLINKAVGSLFPDAARQLARGTKKAIDAAMGDIGNYSEQYAETLEQFLSEDSEPRIPVCRFVWSGANNHVARAVAALELLEDLRSLEVEPGRRVLLWAHSHGGNVLALVSNLLTAQPGAIERFFDAVGDYWEESERRRELRQRLLDEPRLLAETPLDMVTFGMPIRYGWDRDGQSRLLHIVNHHARSRRRSYRAAAPRSAFDVLAGLDGDYVQHVGIAGTNFSTPLLPKMWKADVRLASFLAPDQHVHLLPRRVAAGQRVAHEGTTLLVDYGAEPSLWLRHFLGHGLYTHCDWLLLHAELIASRFYAEE